MQIIRAISLEYSFPILGRTYAIVLYDHISAGPGSLGIAGIEACMVLIVS
jgi:hypothetical protein